MIDWGAWDVALAVLVGDLLCMLVGWVHGWHAGATAQHQADHAALAATRAAAREAESDLSEVLRIVANEGCGPSPREVAALVPLDTRLTGPAIRERAQ